MSGFGEPWRKYSVPEHDYVLIQRGICDGIAHVFNEDDADRACACVNALDGVNTERVMLWKGLEDMCRQAKGACACSPSEFCKGEAMDVILKQLDALEGK